MRLKIALLIALLSLTPSFCLAEDLNAIFNNVNKYVTDKNYPKAIEELGWAKKEIEKLHSQRLESFLPDEVAGYKGQKIESSSALGMVNIERKYTSGSQVVNVSLVGGSSGQAGGFGNIAAIGRMAAMMGGNSPGMDTIRINGRTASIKQNNNSTELSLFLDSGSMFKLEGRGMKDGEALKTMAGAFNIDALDNYLKGQS